MSDFFGDDFTAELKTYFLDSLNKEVSKFLDLVDDSTWRRLLGELESESSTWTADAVTNEFLFLAGWLEELKKSLPEFTTEGELHSSLANLKAYIEVLLVQKKDSAELAQSYSWQKSGSATKQFLHCRVGMQEFVLPVMSVVEIVSGDRKVAPIPVAKEHLIGVIPYRGEAIPVFDLAYFGFQDVEKLKSYFVICEKAGAMFALQVTETDELMTLDGHTFQEVDGGSTLLRAPFVSHFFVRDNRSIMILDLEKLVA